MSSIGEIFRAYAPEYLRRFGDSMPAEHRKVVDAILGCRTEVNGSVVYHCESCDRLHLVHRGCGNRHCPGCQNHKSRQWLQKQLKRQLPGHHFMLTFTVPEALRSFLRSHQRIGYSALFAASSAAIKRLAADPKFVGGDAPGFFGVLHTWGRQLQYHPHIHFVVPGGALDSRSGLWHPSSAGFFLPVHALSKIYRAVFRERMAKAGLLGQIPPGVWSTDWNVNSQAVGSAEASIKYLTPYVFRVAISNSRIVKVEDGKVFVHYKKTGSNRLRTLELEATEFIRRFLQHVLPTGFMKVRYYGLLSPASRIPLEEVRAKIEFAFGFALTTAEVEQVPLPAMTCRHCGCDLTYRHSILPHHRRIAVGAPSG
jgi:hypothetical protein